MSASRRGKPLKISDSLGLSKWPSTSLRDLPRSSRISACSTLRTSRKSRGFGALSVTASTIALPQSLIVDERIGDDEDAERGAADDDELEGLHQHFEMAAERRVAAEHAADGDDQPMTKFNVPPPVARP